MAKLKPEKESQKKGENKIALRGGTYSIIVTVIVLAILIVINYLVSNLPVTMTKYDISASKLYSVTSNTKAVVNALDKDVTIYWIVQADQEDEVIENLLGKYESLSDHIKVVKKNPDVYPTFAQKYTDETVKNNSLVVECDDRSKYISYDDIYIQEPDLYTYSVSNYFDGEGAITSAIDYVTTDEHPQLYVLEGHGEAEIPETFSDQIEKDNIEINKFSLLKVDSIPDDADAILIYAPTSDISEKEKEMLDDYVSMGGKLLVMAGPTENGVLTNLYSLLSDYGVNTVDGIVVEGDRQHFAFEPYVLLPDMENNEITKSLIEENYFPVMPISQGLTVNEEAKNVTKLLNTSDYSFSKVAGYNMNTLEKEEGDIDGPFTVAVSIDTDFKGKIVWFASSTFLDEMYNAYSAGANVDMAMNAMASLIGESEAMAIRSRSLDYNYLTISDSTSSMLKVLMVGVFPLIYLGIGIIVVISRRRMQNETV